MVVAMLAVGFISAAAAAAAVARVCRRRRRVRRPVVYAELAPRPRSWEAVCAAFSGCAGG